METVFVIVHS